RLDAFVGALQQLVDRHDVLRTAVVWQGLPEPVQVVWRRARLEVETLTPDAGDAAAPLRARAGARSFPLGLGQAPLLRAFVARDGRDGRWQMRLVLHHLAIDHVAGDVLMQELALIQAGRAAELPAAVPFRNFVAQARLGVSAGAYEAFFRHLL